MSYPELKEMAPEGQVWVCPCCGKYNKNRYNVGDVSCYVNAVLCHDDETLKVNNGTSNVTTYGKSLFTEPKALNKATAPPFAVSGL